MENAMDGAVQSATVAPTANPLQRKSRFNRPAWASKAGSTITHSPKSTNDLADPFNRSRETLSYLEKERERERALAEKEKEGQEQKKLSKQEETSSRKRRRLERDQDNVEDGVSPTLIRSTELEPLVQASPPKTQEEDAIPIDVDSPNNDYDSESHMKHAASDSTHMPVISSSKPHSTIHKIQSSPLNSSNGEVVHKTHAEHDRKQNQEIDTYVPTPESPVSPQPPLGAPSSFAAISPNAKPKSPMDDFILKILINSRIPNTTPLIANRRISQRLKEVRDAWLSRQTSLSEAQKKSIFFVWRGQTIYDFTTCKSLGICANEMGEVWFEQRATGRKHETVEPSEENSQVAFEAVTDEILKQDKKDTEERRRKEAERKAGRSRLGPGFDTRAGAATATGEKDPSASPEKSKSGAGERGIRVVLRAKGKEDYKLKVNPTTQFSKILAAVRKHYKLSPSTIVSLRFDGERLAEDDEMQTLEDFENEDCIEVVIQ